MNKYVGKNLSIILLALLVSYQVFSRCDLGVLECKGLVNTPAVFVSRIDSILENIRQVSSNIARKFLPSPHSELLLGLTMGIDNLSRVPKFKEALVDTGTIHVVVVSGYNITLVFVSLTQIIGSVYRKRNAVVVLVLTLAYSVLTGFEAPVVRAWVMTAVLIAGKYYGRRLPLLRVLFVSGLLMCALNPNYVFSVSFQLSFSATMSLVMFGEMVQKALYRIIPLDNVLTRDFSATVSAQIMTWPLISYYFGRVSIHSFLVNALVLWTVPISTILGMVFIVSGLVHHVFGTLSSLLVFVPLDIFVRAIKLSDSALDGTVEFGINLLVLVAYYLAVFLIYFLFRKGNNSAQAARVQS